VSIPDEEVAIVRSSTDLVSLIGEYTALRRVGRRLVGLCPFHAERTGSFSVNAEEGLYYCFGCQAKGDAISFVRAIEGCDFVEAVERLGARAGIEIHNDAPGETGASRDRKAALLAAMQAAVAFYHEQLLHHRDAGPARHYLRSRGLDAAVVRRFALGWAPDGGNELSRALQLPEPTLIDAGLAFEDSRGRLRDGFRGRIIFPIFDPSGRPIALGGRVLPLTESGGGPKYRNSPETPLYSKRRTLYGLNLAKTAAIRDGEIVVCEGYTDVIGCFGAGIDRAVATCGTALTEDHFRLLARFARRIVLAFDADQAGMAAAERFYAWEARHEAEVAVAALPAGTDPAELALKDPAQLVAAITGASPFLQFRLDRVLSAARLASPEGRARSAMAALTIVAEHPDPLVTDQYLHRVADRCHLDVETLRPRLAELRRSGTAGSPRSEPPRGASSAPRSVPRELRVERDALVLAVQAPEMMAPWLAEELFSDERHRAAYRVLSGAEHLRGAIEAAPEEVAMLLHELAVSEPATEPLQVVLSLVRAAAAAYLRTLRARAREAAEAGDSVGFARAARDGATVQHHLEVIRDSGIATAPESCMDAANELLALLGREGTGGETVGRS
jgi:DNA primase